MKNRTLQFFAAFLILFAVSCQNSGNKSDASGEDETTQTMKTESAVKAELEALKDKSNDLMERISNATYAERKNLQDDVEDFASETKELLTEMETDSDLEQGVEDMLDKIEENTNILVEEAKQFSNKTEEEWEETTSNLGNMMKEIGDEIEEFFNE